LAIWHANRPRVVVAGPRSREEQRDRPRSSPGLVSAAVRVRLRGSAECCQKRIEGCSGQLFFFELHFQQVGIQYGSAVSNWRTLGLMRMLLRREGGRPAPGYLRREACPTIAFSSRRRIRWWVVEIRNDSLGEAGRDSKPAGTRFCVDECDELVGMLHCIDSTTRAARETLRIGQATVVRTPSRNRSSV